MKRGHQIIQGLVFAFLIFLVLGMPFVASAQGKTDIEQGELPHFFPVGAIQTQDPLQQLIEILNYLNVLSECYHHKETNYPVIANNNIVVPLKLYGAETKIIFDGYTRIGKTIRYTTMCEQGTISEQQLTVLVNFLRHQYVRAIEDMFSYYQDVREQAIKIRAKQLKISEEELRQRLSETLPDNPLVIYAELNFIPPPFEKKDFILKELHLAFAPQGVGGQAWLNTGIVYYNHGGLIKDWVTKKPVILGHELVHSNPKLQNLILRLGVDVETMASIPMLFEAENRVDFLFHPYAREFQELTHVFFNFDTVRARKEILVNKTDLNWHIDKEKLGEYVAQTEIVKREMRKFFREVTLPEFYADPMFWSSLHERMKDDALILRVTMAKHYRPTMLGGKQKTALWLSEHQDDIKKFAFAAYKKSGETAKDEDVKIVKNWKSFGFFMGIPQNAIEDQDTLSLLHKKRDLGEFQFLTLSELLDFYSNSLSHLKKGGVP